MRFKREKFSAMPETGGYEQMDGEGGVQGGGGMYGDNVPDSPMSFEEMERPPLRHIDKYTKAECPCLPTQRYTIALMACLGFIISFGMRCNMGMAKLQLEHKNGPNESHPHNITLGGSEIKFKWSVAMESAVDSSFFWGYLVTQVPGGFLASAYPANRIFGTAIACSAFLNLFLPGAFEVPGCIIVIRVLQGLVEGEFHNERIWRFWAPPLERSRLATIAFSGSYAGIVIGMPMSGILTSWISWKAAFYFYGVMGIIWYCFWLWLSFEKPRYHPAISIQELKYIEKSLGESVKLQMPTIATTPWYEISRSMPVYAIIVANFCRSWNFYLLVLYQSKYLKHSFNYEIAEAGILGALPHLLMTIIVPLGGMLADHLRKNGILSTTHVRKLFNCGGFGLEGLFFLFVAHATTGAGAVTALTFGVAFSGFAISGYNVNHLDIAPRYASILMGMSNGIGTIAGLLCPIAIDYLTSDQKDRSCWTTVFTIAACVHLTGITFYGVFASGELQPWAEPTMEEQKAWDPTAPGAIKETSFNDADAMNMQINHTKQVSYGATEHVAGNPFNQNPTIAPAYNQVVNPSNPFAFPSTIQEEPVQPYATDAYMHGTAEDRSFRSEY
ncbi:CLUMA_CG014417, isoform A [Clunio marinus]|uniref:CLUMA_CG014417, isoform A n=1 Tax=Clunio marinus TaxID=568069 RepID=A0A1J1ILU7_9DIPT|nr:CLUMA_CG014417, isoform A [Clunio marinus]